MTNTNQFSIDSIAGVRELTDELASVSTGGHGSFHSKQDINLFQHSGHSTVNNSQFIYWSGGKSQPGSKIDLTKPIGNIPAYGMNDQVTVVDVNKGVWLGTIDVANSQEAVIFPPGEYDLSTQFGGKYNDQFTKFVRIG